MGVGIVCNASLWNEERRETRQDKKEEEQSVLV
jgi:hypothetical protein